MQSGSMFQTLDTPRGLFPAALARARASRVVRARRSGPTERQVFGSASLRHGENNPDGELFPAGSKP